MSVCLCVSVCVVVCCCSSIAKMLSIVKKMQNTQMGDSVSLSLSGRLQQRPTGQQEVHPALLKVAGPILLAFMYSNL